MKHVYELRTEIDKRLYYLKKEERLTAIRHLYGVSDFCAIIALRRNLDSEICAVMGLLHDLWSYEKNIDQNHAKQGAELARKILEDLHSFKKHEIEIITKSIRYHSDKGNTHDEYDEVLKDADVLHHYFDQPNIQYVQSKAKRIKNTLRELGINIKVKKK
jgi:uncharacterized protein